MTDDNKPYIFGSVPPFGIPINSQVLAPVVVSDPAQDLIMSMTIRAQTHSAMAALGNIALVSPSKRSSLPDKVRNHLITEIETGLSQKFATVD